MKQTTNCNHRAVADVDSSSYMTDSENREAKIDTLVNRSVKDVDDSFKEGLSECGVNDKFLSLLFRLIDEGASDERIAAVVRAKKIGTYIYVREVHERNES